MGKFMNYSDAKSSCANRSGIYREGNPTCFYTKECLMLCHPSLVELNRHRVGSLIPNIYYKNHNETLDSRIPDDEKIFDDWEEFDPNDTCTVEFMKKYAPEYKNINKSGIFIKCP